MSATRTHVAKRTLQLSIDPSPYKDKRICLSPSEAAISSASSTLSKVATSIVSPLSAESDWIIYSVLCVYDFESDDSDHLPFRKNEILDVVKQEETGWWAAIRRDNGQVGWIPKAFVEPLSKEMAERLRTVREEVRVFEFDAEKLYASAPVSNNRHLYDSVPSPSPSQEWVPVEEGQKSTSTQMVTPTDLVPPQGGSFSDSSVDSGYFTEGKSSPNARSRQYPPTPSTPTPQPPVTRTAPLVINKPTPPTPSPIATFDSSDLTRSRSESATVRLQGRSQRRQPMLLDDQNSLARLSTLMETNNVEELEKLASPQRAGSFELARRATTPIARASADKLPEEDDALTFFNSKIALTHLPWYLRPRYTFDQLKVRMDGTVKAGTLSALLERLTSDPYNLAQESTYRHTFLMTFRTFTTAEKVFESLVDRYELDRPQKLSAAEFETWKEKKLRPTQNRVLTVLTMWLEDHKLLEEEPRIARRLTEFLSLIVAPPAHALTAKLILESLERLTFGESSGTSPVTAPPRRRKSKAHKNDLLRLDPTDVAEHLCLLEYNLYSKIRPQECINWAKTQTGTSVTNLQAFCATHDQLAGWVKSSILNVDILGKRADTVDFWIKVAEKCRNLQNFSSMSAVLAALSSTSISRLHLTWANSARKSHLDPLLKYNEPTGGFGAYRAVLQSAEGPCVPFIAMCLTDIVHVGDQMPNNIPSSSAEDPLICFTKRQKWHDIVCMMLRHQSKTYNYAEDEPTKSFVARYLKDASEKDQDWFWVKSQEVQQLELSHADIRKGLEAAGF